MIKLKNLLIEGPFDKLRDMERFIERSLPSSLKRYGSIDIDTSNMIVAYRGRISPNTKSGSEYESLIKEIRNFIKKIEKAVQKQNGTISFNHVDEWVGFDIKLKELKYDDPNLISDLFGKPPKDSIAWVKHTYYSAILYYDPNDSSASRYANNVEKIIRKDNLEDEYKVGDKWKEFLTSSETKRDEAKKNGTLIKV